MEQNKTGKYLKYAIGEVILVVIGILIALSINNWNELRKSNIERNELIVSMISDFELTQIEVSKLVLSSKSRMEKNTELLNALKSKPFTKSRKTTNDLISSYFDIDVFTPTLTAFKAAQANNKLKLLDSNRLLQLLSNYDTYSEGLQKMKGHAGQNYFSGALYDMRKKAGTLDALSVIKSNENIYGFSDKELIAFLSEKESYASFWTTSKINQTINEFYTFLERTGSDILIELNNIK